MPVLKGGYVLGGGAICMELLTKQVYVVLKVSSVNTVWYFIVIPVDCEHRDIRVCILAVCQTLIKLFCKMA